ncbi:hypothetical protein C3Y87_20585 [Carbonactinospora thermoautotrophica]|nr:hypothetical protein [Carbonactinospora thermoautotrophica]
MADLAAGPSGNAGTYLPGRIVRGVVLRDTEVEIHVVARYGPPLPEVAAQVQRAVAPLVPGGAVHVAIDDIVDDTVDDTATPEPSPRADPG